MQGKRWSSTSYTQFQASEFERDLLAALAGSGNPTDVPTSCTTIPFVYFLDEAAAATFIEQKLLVLAGQHCALTAENDPLNIRQYLRLKTTPRPQALGRSTRHGRVETVAFSILVTNPLTVLHATSSASGKRRHPDISRVLRGLLVSTGPAHHAKTVQQAQANEQRQERTNSEKRKLAGTENSTRTKVLRKVTATPIPGLPAFAPAAELDQVLKGLLSSEAFTAELGSQVAAKQIALTKQSIDALHKSGKLQQMEAYQELAKKGADAAARTVGSSDHVHKHLVSIAAGDLASDRQENEEDDGEPKSAPNPEIDLAEAEGRFQHSASRSANTDRSQRSKKKDKKHKSGRHSASSTPKPKPTSVAPEKLLKIKLRNLQDVWSLRKHAEACVAARAALSDEDQHRQVRINLKERIKLARANAQGLEDNDLSS